MGLLKSITKLIRKKKKEKKKTKKERPKLTKIPRSESQAILKSLKEWELTIKRIQTHPFSQVKIINVSLLESLTDVLRDINSKLDNLTKIDEILEILKQSQIELKSKGVESEKLDVAIERLAEFTLKDKKALQIIRDKGPMTAEQFSEAAKVSRSTASFRLNRLFEKGLVNKIPRGRQVLFQLKES